MGTAMASQNGNGNGHSGADRFTLELPFIEQWLKWRTYELVNRRLKYECSPCCSLPSSLVMALHRSH